MDAPNDHIRDATAQNFQQSVVQRSREIPVVVDFWAEWCGPCKVLEPLLEQITREANGSFDLVKIDVDSNQELAEKFDVQSIPTVIAFRDGVVAERFTGVYPEAALRTWIDSFLPTDLDRKIDQARDAAITGDLAQAERLFREVLDEDSSHGDAGTSLASLLIAAGNTEEALIVLGKLTPDSEVERLQAAARLSASRGDDVAQLENRLKADSSDTETRLALSKALAARAEFEPALDHLISVIREKGDRWNEARQAMLDIFGVLGNEHPLTATYRRELANALF